MRQQAQDDGFNTLTYIIIEASPHPCGEARDLINYVVILNMKHEDKLVEYYTTAKEMKIEIKVQQDETVQSNILIQRFIKQTTINEYKMTLQTMTKETNNFLKQESWYKDTSSHTTDDIYDKLMEGQ